MVSSFNVSSKFHTPYDDIIPDIDDNIGLFYTDFIRIYLALCCRTTTLEEAIKATEILKKHPEYAKNPINPLVIPQNERILNKIISNLNTLKKYNLNSSDSLRSACTFAILGEETPLSKTDSQVLTYFIQHPLSTYQKASEEIGISPQTVSNSFNRLIQKHSVRFASIMDATAFGAQRVIVFFTLKEGVDWLDVEHGLANYPYTKSILKTVTADLGYASFIIPGNQSTLPVFKKSMKSLKKSIFDYLSFHHEIWTGVNSNFTLLEGQKWRFPSEIITRLEDKKDSHIQPQALIKCSGLTRNLTKHDFVVASQLAIDARISPVTMYRTLLSKGWDLDEGRISKTIQMLYRSQLVEPYVYLGGVGLTTNMTVEITCNLQLINDITSLFCLAPSCMFFASSRGLLLWLMIPSSQQVQYYQILEKLEEKNGVKQIWPIMTISHRGSRSILDLVHNWQYGKNGWWVPKEQLDIRKYVYDNL